MWTLGSLIAITIVKLLAFDYVGPATPFLLYFLSVIVATWYGGWPAGLVTTVISSALGSYFFKAPFGSLRISDAAGLVRIAVFLLEGAAITAITARMKDERTRADAAAQDARRSLAKLESVLRGVSDGITVQDARGALVYVNDTAARLSGFPSAEAMLATPPSEIMARFELLDASGKPFPLTELPGRLVLRGLPAPERLVRFRDRATGGERWTYLRANAVRVEGADVPHAVNVFHDVTESRQQQEAVRVSQEWLSTTLKSIGDAVIATDARGQIAFMNPVAEQLTGWTSSEAAQEPLRQVFRIVNQDTRLEVPSPVDTVLREGTVVGLANHTVLIGKDGTERAIDDSAAPIRSPQGDLVGTVLIFRDVSQRRADEARRAFVARATAELASSLDYRRTLSTVARLAVPGMADWCAVDVLEEGQLRRLAVEHSDPERVRLVFDIERRYPADPGSDRGTYQVLRTGEPIFLPEIPDAMLVAGARDAEHLFLIRQLRLRSFIAVPLRASGSTIGVLTLAMADSGRTHDERDLDLAVALADRASLAVQNARLFSEATQARKIAEQANRAKDEFLAMLGHELRNPLAPLVTALQLMKVRAPDVLERERSIMERQTKYLITLVNDLLDVSRIARGKVELAREELDVADVLAKSLELAGPLIEERRHQVVPALASGLRVSGDPVRLAQVFANLLTNAAKYTEPGGHIQVTARRTGAQIEVTVQDDGVGIPAELLPRVFDLFVQGDQAPDRAKGGLGLGLAIARSVVDLHGGQVLVDSPGPGLGSTFRVVLPVSQPAATDAPAVAVTPPRVGLDGLKVLAVDDNADALELLAEALTMFGCSAHTARDPISAIARAADVRPDVALLDIGLPLMDGYQLAGRLRETPGLEGVKLVAITGYGQASDRERALAAGFDAFLVKPISIDDVQRVLSDLVAPDRRPAEHQ